MGTASRIAAHLDMHLTSGRQAASCDSNLSDFHEASSPPPGPPYDRQPSLTPRGNYSQVNAAVS